MNGRLEFIYNGIITPLRHRHYEYFVAAKDAEDDLLADEIFTFRANLKGQVCVLESPFEPLVGTIVFSKKPDAEMSDPEYQSQLVGDYDLDGKIITIEVSDKNLKLKEADEKAATLEPALGKEFTVEDSTWDFCGFTMDEKGKVKGLVLEKRGRLYPAKRPELKSFS